jgi:hypothetical protein
MQHLVANKKKPRERIVRRIVTSVAMARKVAKALLVL